MVGIDAVMRWSELTLPSATGTLRSWRISTRLPARSRSVMRTMVMGIPAMQRSLLSGPRAAAANRAQAAGLPRNRLKAKPATTSAPSASTAHSSHDFQS